MTPTGSSTSTVRFRQDLLCRRYAADATDARITDHARTVRSAESDPFHGQVHPGSKDYGIEWPFGIHHAVGGDHDLPNPGDILCAALATCLDSTIRMIADRLRVRLEALEVDVTGNVDVRGTLLVDRSVPVGFQQMRCDIHLKPAADADPDVVRKLLAAAEHSCVVLQTLRSGVPVETTLRAA